MLNKKRMVELLDEIKNDGTTGTFRLRLRILSNFMRLKRRVLKNKPCTDGKDGSSIYLWLKENFARVEEGVMSNIQDLKGMKHLEANGVYPRYFEVFKAYFSENEKVEETQLRELFKTVNEHGTVDMGNAFSLLTLCTSAVYDGIVSLFNDAFDSKAEEGRLLSGIEAMFDILDCLSEFTQEDVLEHNPVEKILLGDPANVYVRLSVDTKNSYRRNLILLAKRQKMSQLDAAISIVNSCKKEETDKRHIGRLLCDKPCHGKTYIFLAVFLTLLFTVLLCLVSPVFVITVIPVYGCVRMLLDKFFVRYLVKPFHLPSLELESIPDKCGVLVVITTLLTGKESDEKIFEKLEKMYFSNGGKNVYFGVLADLEDSQKEVSEKDAEITDKANNSILRLRKKYGDAFFLFLRERRYSTSEGCFIAPERKRGAVMSLVKYLCGKSDSFTAQSIKPGEKICSNVKYVLTLDSDTDLAFDCVRKMAGIMLHPQNTPVCDKEKAVVTKGYGILQPCMSPTVEAASKTFFTKIMCGHGGIDVYSSGGSNNLMALFGKSVFCGKGMFEKNCFYETLCADNGFAKNRILSHDAPEGARLRCAYVQDITFTDSFPKEELSYYKRKHRWIRGDVQNFEFLTSYVTNSNGKRIKNHIDLFSKLMLFDNLYEAVKPIFVLASFVLSVFCERNTGILLISVSASVYILEFVYSVLYLPKRALWHNFKRVYSSDGIYTGVWTSFMLMLFKICSIPKSAVVSADAVCRSIYRMKTGKKTLEWMTAAQSDAESKDGLLGYVKKNLFSAVCGCLLFVVSENGFLRLVALMWLFLPLFSYRTGIVRKRSKRLTEHEENVLNEYLSDMWKYFKDNVGIRTNNLPPDNVSVFPERKVSRMTSPTNIGFYMLSALIARKSGLEDTAFVFDRIEKCVDTIEKLPKYNGLLYNWYDVFECKPMTPLYVSSVDLGNYEACLYCILSGIEEFSDEYKNSGNLTERIKRLIDECRLELLFDKKTKLFFIGCTVEDGKAVFDKNRYDMLMSEARLAGYISVAKRNVPFEHLSRLSRRTVEGGTYMGYASWSGTAFEYFLPEIFIGSPPGTMLYEALAFCMWMQKKAAFKTPKGAVFGISESCYNELDAYSNYKYRAFGVETLAVSTSVRQNVISPYSSFLFLPLSVKDSLANLERLSKIGMYGEYGFYESADFERKGNGEICSVVRCFMSHHVGMSMAAAANALFDNILHKWFCHDARISCAADFAHEKIPYNAYVKKIHRRNYSKSFDIEKECAKRPVNECRFARLKNENLELYAKRDRLKIKFGRQFLLSPYPFGRGFRSLKIEIEVDDERFVLGKNCVLSSTDGKIILSERIKTSGRDIFDISLSLTLLKNTSEIVKIRLRARQLSGERNKRLLVSFSFCPLLESENNLSKCTCFENETEFFTMRPDGYCAYENRASGIFMYSGITCGKNAECKISDGCVSHTAVAEAEDSVYECRLALSVSANEKCAWMGLVRADETDFDKTSEELAKKNRAVLNSNREKSRTSVKSEILGSMTENKDSLYYPKEILEKRAIVLSGNRFAAVVFRDGLGFSFVKNANSGRISRYNRWDNSFCERLTVSNDGFDLCKNSVDFSSDDGAVQYSGEYDGSKYGVEVFVPENESVKIIRVKASFRQAISFCLLPSTEFTGRIETAGGFTSFIGKKEKSLTGFVYGFCPDSAMEACYDVTDRIAAEISCTNENDISEREYVFVIGTAKSREEAGGIILGIRTSIEKLRESSGKMYQRLVSDISSASTDVRQMLKNDLSITENVCCYTSLTDTSEGLSAINVLLLAYADAEYFKNALRKFLVNNEKCSVASGFACAVGLCEYVRVTRDTAFADETVNGETVYRRVLSMLFDSAERSNKKNAFPDMRKNALMHMSMLCDRLRDVRTAERLRDAAHDTEKDSGGIFL